MGEFKHKVDWFPMPLQEEDGCWFLLCTSDSTSLAYGSLDGGASLQSLREWATRKTTRVMYDRSKYYGKQKAGPALRLGDIELEENNVGTLK